MVSVSAYLPKNLPAGLSMCKMFRGNIYLTKKQGKDISWNMAVDICGGNVTP